MDVSGNVPETMWLSGIKSDHWLLSNKVSGSHLGESVFGLDTCLIHVLMYMNPKSDLLFGVKKETKQFIRIYNKKEFTHNQKSAKCREKWHCKPLHSIKENKLGVQQGRNHLLGFSGNFPRVISAKVDRP